MAMPMAPRYSVADLADLPEDGCRHELIRGVLVVSPAPSVHHQIIVGRIADAIANYLTPLGLRNTLFAVDRLDWRILPDAPVMAMELPRLFADLPA